MDKSFQQHQPHGQVNPGQIGQKGEEATIKKNESISDQGNEWSDQEGIHTDSKNVLGEKAEKYIRDSADIEDLPEEEDEKNARKVEEENKEKNSKVKDEGKEEDEVIERKEDYVPGYDLGRNKVQ
ncbi:MAG: hypothetical protein INR73_19750 [Williamsia sp.]|nr:hypothetical protein [Williamsia sp.]